MSTLQRKQVKGQKQHLNILWGRGPRKINTPFYKAFVIKPFQILCPVLTSYFPLKYNRDSVDFKETPAGKIFLGRCVEQGVSFHGRNKFF